MLLHDLLKLNPSKFAAPHSPDQSFSRYLQQSHQSFFVFPDQKDHVLKMGDLVNPLQILRQKFLLTILYNTTLLVLFKDREKNSLFLVCFSFLFSKTSRYFNIFVIKKQPFSVEKERIDFTDLENQAKIFRRLIFN